VYEVVAPIGAGGMGEVYRARDTKLGRDVAIKVVPDAFLADPERLHRFGREARSLAALNHPHIATLHGMEEAGGRHFLVMELVDGATVADLIKASAMPLEATLSVAIQIADALEAAHEKGIVHRDLKPANVKVTADGKVKVLDFGLAKGGGSEAARADGVAPGISPAGTLANSPTFTATGTMAGLILGTAAYMSPEQARGMPVDHRSDIFSFGVVLYEMLSGRQPFLGDTVSDVLASVIARDPDLSKLPPGIAPRLTDLVKRCLEKQPKRRWQAIGDVRHELEQIAADPRAATAVGAAVDASAIRGARRRELVAMGAAIVALAALAVVSYRWYPRQAPVPPPITFTIDPPQDERFAPGPGLLSVSPDGRRIAFFTGTGQSGHMWIRDLESLISKPIPRADDGWQPAWSPDSRWIVITGAGSRIPLRKVEVATGAVVTLAPASIGRPAWSPSGVILFDDGAKLMRVPEAGGTPTVAMDLDPSGDEISLTWPLFLPDGRRYVFLARRTDASKSSLFLASLDSPARTFLVNTVSSVEYAGGYLFYLRDGAVIAHPFDAEAGRLTGDAFPVLDDVRYNSANGRVAMSVSASGALAYVKGGSTSSDRDRRLVMFDRSGSHAKQIGPPGPYQVAVLSPDGRQAVVEEQMPGEPGRSLSLLDVERGLSSRFTIGDVSERTPIWFQDGSSVVFTSQRNGAFGLYRRSAAGGATGDELLFSAPELLEPTGLSPDGKVLLFARGARPTIKIWALPLTGDRKPIEAIPGVPMAQYQATFSPDGTWIAYGAGSGPGDGEIYIQPYPADDRRVRISTATGRYPFWTDGRHIVYRSTDDDLMSVELIPSGNTFRPAPPIKLFTPPKIAPGTWAYSMDARGERFLVVAPSDKPAPEIREPLTVVVNWVANLRKPR
jgi:Tol biopolymer transport system component